MTQESLPEDSISAFLEAREQERRQSKPSNEALHRRLEEFAMATDAKAAAYAKLEADFTLLQAELQRTTIELERIQFQLQRTTSSASAKEELSSTQESQKILGLGEFETADVNDNTFNGHDFRAINDHPYVMNSVEQEHEASLGTHLLVEFYGCPDHKLKLENYIRSVIYKAVEAASATRIGGIFHQFRPYGVAGVAVIQESHFSIHTWPEHGYAALDFFYCGDLEIDKAIRICCVNLQPERIAYVSIKRGLQTPVESASGPSLARVQFSDGYRFDLTGSPAPVR